MNNDNVVSFDENVDVETETLDQENEISIEDQEEEENDEHSTLSNKLEEQINECESISPIPIKKNQTKRKSKSKHIVDPLPPEDTIRKTQLISTITQYKLVFPQHMTTYIKKFDLKYLGKLTEEELKSFLNEIRTTVACLNSGSSLVHIYGGACDLIEMGGKAVGLDLEGFSDNVMQNPDVINPLNELILEKDLFYVRPEYRLLMGTLSTVKATLAINKEKLKEKLKGKVDKNLLNSTKDL